MTARRITWMEGAVAFAIGGSLLAVSVPAFVREVHASRLTEALEGVSSLSAACVAHAAGRPTASAFPPSVPLTPATPPRGVKELDPPGTWSHPSWVALAFRAAPDGVPHAFAYALDTSLGAEHSTFVARARGDLDGDGQLSSFEARGAARGGHGSREPGLYVEAELE